MILGLTLFSKTIKHRNTYYKYIGIDSFFFVYKIEAVFSDIKFIQNLRLNKMIVIKIQHYFHLNIRFLK